MWISVECAEGLMPPRYNGATAQLDTQIFIFGGFGRDDNLLHTLNCIDYQPRG